MREVAARGDRSGNMSVGKDYLAVISPRQVVESSCFRMADGSTALLSLCSPPRIGARSFLYIPESGYLGIQYGPYLVYGGSILGDFFATFSADGQQMNISASTIRLAEGAKQGVIILEDGTFGQTISLPPEE